VRQKELELARLIAAGVVISVEFHFENLDEKTRQFMLDEFEQDLKNNKLYISPRLSERGRTEYPNLLRDAINTGDDSTLASAIATGGRLNPTEPRRTRTGVTTAKVPVTAPETLAEGEFNRFYARGLCRRAIANGIKELVIYRAKRVANPRPESQAKIGTSLSPQALLQDLRTHQGVDPALGLPPGPNSGLSVKLP
jgi:hypothetical protein